MDLAEIVRAHGKLAFLAADAAARELEIGALLSVGGYSLVFEVHPRGGPPCVLKVPWAAPRTAQRELQPGDGPIAAQLASETGPFEYTRVRSIAEAAALLLCAVDRQRARPTRILPALLETEELGGTPVALYERIDPATLLDLGPVDPVSALRIGRDVASALLELHASFGPHGDLKPAHVSLRSGEGVRLLDPLCHPDWCGSAGYTLGWPSVPPGHEGAAAMRDLGALAAILAELSEAAIGWTAGLARLVANRHNGRFGRGLDFGAVHARLDRAADRIAEPLAGWIRHVGRAYLDQFTKDEIPDRAWCTRALERLEGLG